MNMDIKPYYFDYAKSEYVPVAWKDIGEKPVIPPKGFNCKHCGAVGQSGVCEYCGSAEE